MTQNTSRILRRRKFLYGIGLENITYHKMNGIFSVFIMSDKLIKVTNLSNQLIKELKTIGD